MSKLFQNRKATILIVFIVCVSIGFWSISRYPQLSMKSNVMHRGAISETGMIQGKITHTINRDESTDITLAKRIYNTTLNWIFANWRGMSFGLVIGAGFLTLLRNLSLNMGKNRFLNALYGMITGVPLGVCSNCVAPIMQSTFKGNGKMEYSLAKMFASPMLNIIVLTILFSIFPIGIAIANTIAVLILILVVTPILAHYTAKPHEEACNINSACAIQIKQSWGKSFMLVTMEYAKDLLYLFIRVVPLMIVAGFIGAVLIHLVSPAEFFANSTLSYIILIPLSALFATLLPMPIVIDLMLAQSLWIAGVPLEIIAVFVFALGSYSIYSFLIVTQTFSLKIALIIYSIVVVISSILGYITILL